MTSLGQLAVGRDNNLNLLRFLAATAVIVTHSFSVITGRFADEPLVALTGRSIGHYAVDIFFVVSGFLVTRSLLANRDPVDFVVSRLTRIVPALWITVLLVSLVLGPLVSTLPVVDYLSSPALFDQLIGTLSTTNSGAGLPGVFETLPADGEVNEPLWTLKYELSAYSVLFIAYLMLHRARPIVWAMAAMAGLAAFIAFRWSVPWMETSGFSNNLAHLLLCFALGTAAYAARAIIPLHAAGILALGALAYVAFDTGLREVVEAVFVGYAALWFAFAPGGVIRRFNALGDYSYGLYIMAFPVQQTVRLLLPDIGSAGLFLIAFPITLGLAVLSWTMIEAPALRHRKRITRYLKRQLRLADEQAGGHLKPVAGAYPGSASTG